MLTIVARLCRRMPLAFAMAACLSASVFAHEGHDHGFKLPVTSAPLTPRLVLSSERYELVGIYQNGGLTLYLDRTADNAPITSAKISLAFGEIALEAKVTAKGSYRAEGTPLTQPTSQEVIVTIQDQGGDDLLIGTLDLTSLRKNRQEASEKEHLTAGFSWSHGVSLFVGGLILGFALRGRKVAATAVFLAVLASAAAPKADAHGGEDHGDIRPTIMGDTPRRLDDGSLFIPKPTQRLLAVRTAVSVTETVRPAVRFIGRIIPDPGRSGYVQSINGGRIILTGASLPKLGQTVKAGDVFAEIEPPITTGDYSTLSEKAGDLEQQIVLAEAKVRRYTPLAPSGAIAANQLEDAKFELEGLKRRKATLLATKREHEVLRAPVDGVITLARAAPGQVVEPREILFQIIDPASLWVEALAFDPRNAETIEAAYAILESGERLPLSFQGKGRSLQQHATLLQFSIAPSPAFNLSVGLPVTVLAERQGNVTGIVLPKTAVVRGDAGETVLFIHMAPELFESRPVKVEPVDGDRVLVTGVEPGLRVVVSGAELLNQVR